jgi:O-acetyl-ADP-ribose deacetylase (regulator of RNase III)
MIVKKLTYDVFEVASVCDYMVNLTNTRKVMGAGLAKEFKTRLPESYFDRYCEACDSGELRIGTILVHEDVGETWGVLDFPSKRHWMDKSDPSDISRGLEALRGFLLEDKNKHATIALPLPGVGLGKLDYQTVLPLVEQYLEDLEATIFVCMSPDRTEDRPRYLTIAGPLDYPRSPEDQENIASIIDRVMTSWKTSLSEYEAVVSGGYPGVDQFIAGEHYGKDFEKSFAYRHTGKKPLVVKPNIYKNGVGANLHLGNLLCEISEDVILFKPPGHNNNRLSAMQTWLRVNKEERQRQGITTRRVAVYGDAGVMRTPEDVIVPQEADVPY